MLTWPMASIGWVTSIIQRASASQKRINEFLNTKPEINIEEGKIHNVQGKISFKNINFKYPGSGIKALDNVSFIIEKGQSIAIVGRTGSGKSTIVNLMCRMYKPTSGIIEIDDVAIEEINLASLRKEISLVPQESLLFSDTISNNIAFGSKEKLTEEDIELAAIKSSIHENIKSFSKSYQTLVGERGVTLSGGQKQRISIARALVRPTSILIFDDCLSALDNETEEKILSSLKKEFKNKTTITISHRISSIQNADKIIVLDKGKIAEIGTHSELFEKGEIYYEMYQQQLSK